jgi:hypothetical protein
MSMINFLRTLLGIRKKRQPLPISPRPPLGATIVRRSVKMTVTEPLNEEVWDWMLLSGWRVSAVRNDRRKSVDLPSEALKRLLAAEPDKRAEVHARLLRMAGANK